jgi:hypothetical protein
VRADDENAPQVDCALMALVCPENVSEENESTSSVTEAGIARLMRYFGICSDPKLLAGTALFPRQATSLPSDSFRGGGLHATAFRTRNGHSGSLAIDATKAVSQPIDKRD